MSELPCPSCATNIVGINQHECLSGIIVSHPSEEQATDKIIPEIAALKGKLDRGEITPEEYLKKTRSFVNSIKRRKP